MVKRIGFLKRAWILMTAIISGLWDFYNCTVFYVTILRRDLEGKQ